MKLRIVSRPHWLYGRAYYVERERKFLIWRYWADLVDPPFGYDTEAEAKARAEEYARGSWVSDTARFE